MNKTEQLRLLYQECNLTKEDVHKHQFYTIITRTGIEKIMFAKGIKITYQEITVTQDYCAVKAVATLNDEVMETYGSASVETSNNKYYLEMAEKRAMSRAVLKLTKGYSLGLYGQDEMKEFEQFENHKK
tara:strand:- start:549 stop:935 length:387 start_codon:yes stop_codon:yes gene_type:complete